MSSLFHYQMRIARAIATDQAIRAVCIAAFNKPVTVFVGIDKLNPPPVSSCPWVGLAVPGYERPVKDNGHTASFTLDSAVYVQDERIEQDAQCPEITIMKGVETIEVLSDLVFSVIEKSISTSATQVEMTYMSESDTAMGVTDLPEFAALRSWIVGVKS